MTSFLEIRLHVVRTSACSASFLGGVVLGILRRLFALLLPVKMWTAVTWTSFDTRVNG
jgi:hypothetical protein